MVRRIRLWICWRLLKLARLAHPSSATPLSPENRYWQIIEVPRRISETEARELAATVRNF